MKRKLLLIMLSLIFLTNAVKAQEPDDDKPIKIDTLLLTMPLVVKDKNGHNVTGLKKEDFSIIQNGDKQNIEYFFNEESPMNVAILIDTSASTKEVLDKIQKAARDFIKVLRPEDRAIIVSFDYRTLFLSELTSDKKKLSKAIEQTRVADQAGSDVNRAVVQLVNNYFDSFKGRKAIIVLSDGMTLRRDISTQQTLETLQKADTLFYPIVFKTKFYAQARQRASNNNRKPLPMEMLEFLATETTGRFYEKDAANLKEAFQNIAEELKKQYLLGFYPQNTNTGYLNKNIRIMVDRKDLRIETKKKWQF
ncbi:hypothetical protein BH20ACI1_BH20ACI1_07290 [soil metagenome]